MKKPANLIYNNTDMEQKISRIRQTVALHMNGSTAQSMQEMGLKYDKNYGVSIPDLRSIARNLQANKDLAVRLWQINIREMKILATLLFPADELDRETAEFWRNECINIELIEQAVMNLFQHWKLAVDFSLECLQSDDKNGVIFGLLLAQRSYARFEPAQTGEFIYRTFEILNHTSDHVVARYTGTALAAFCRKNKEVALKLKNAAILMEKTDNKTHQIVKQLIEQEIDFLQID